MSVIYQLSPHVADLIAAGEVVERPGSAVKELVENSIDAGATHIIVEIQNGGMSVIRVTDDGCGMDRNDAQTAFLRHATSKLRKAEDLNAIGTLGFRGEALAAISSVSRITLLTCQEGGRGTALNLEAGIITSCEDAGCPKGTTMVVRDLFYNTPARLKFMKTDVAEGANVFTVMQRLAIAHPEIAFRMIRDGQEVLATTGDGKLISVIYVLLGRQMAKEMVEVRSSWEKFSLTGYVSRPMTTRGNRNGQMFYVNGRFVKSKTLTAAFEEAYRNQMMTGRFPSCVLNIEMPLNMVDVNVHPAKTEVRFLAEKSVFDCVYYGVLSALGKASGKKDLELQKKSASSLQGVVTGSGNPSGTYRTMTAEEYRNMIATINPTDSKQTAENRDRTENCHPAEAPRTASPEPVSVSASSAEYVSAHVEEQTEIPQQATEPVASFQPVPAAVSRPISIFPTKEEAVLMGMEEPEKQKEEDSTEQEQPAEDAETQNESEQTELPLKTEAYRVVGEIMNCYILVEEPGAMLFIDKHAAHERILFEKLKKQDNRAMAQLLLTPITAQLNREEAAVLLENTTLLRECGFEIEDFGDHTVLIREIPDDLNENEAENLLAEMATDLLNGKNADPSARRDTLLHTMACKAAIKGGWHTQEAEREAIVREVMSREDLKYCPHGRPICIRLTESSLRRQFNRS